jgi:hypothetical protein
MPRLPRQHPTLFSGANQPEADTETSSAGGQRSEGSATPTFDWASLGQELLSTQRALDEKPSTQWESLKKEYGSPADPTTIRTVVQRLVIHDPFVRDAHLGTLDPWMLRPIQQRRMSFTELMEVVKREDPVCSVAAPEAGFKTPVVWRWLRDAEMRGLIEPDTAPERPTTSTSWSLTEAGAARARKWSHGFTVRVLTWPFQTATRASAIVAVLAAIIAVAAVIVGEDELRRWVKENLLPNWHIAARVIGFIFFFTVVVDILYVLQSILGRRTPSPRTGIWDREVWMVKKAIWTEAALQYAISALPDVPRAGFEPPPDHDGPPPSSPGAPDRTANRNASRAISTTPRPPPSPSNN